MSESSTIDDKLRGKQSPNIEKTQLSSEEKEILKDLESGKYNAGSNGNGNGKVRGKADIDSNKQEKQQTKEEAKDKGIRNYTVYKYSKDIGLAEEILLGNQSVFLQIVDEEPIISSTIDLSKEKNIILKPHENSSQITQVIIPYSFRDIDEIRYFIRIAKGKSIDDLFLMSESLWEKILVAKDSEVITFYTTDTIYSYFQDLFPTTHYDMIIGNPGAGKGAILVSFRLQGYRAVMASGMSGANLLELLGSVEACQITLLEDEFQNIDKDPDKEGIYKIGYDETNLVPKTLDGSKSSRHNKWYYPYCFKIFAAEKPPDAKSFGGFNDRTFRIKSLRGKPKILVKNILHEIQKSEDKQKPKYRRIISKIHYLRKLLLIYRILHHDDIFEEVSTNIDGRALELTSPQIYLFNSDKLASKEEGKRVLHKKILPALSKFLKEKGELSEKTIEGVVYEALLEIFHSIAAENTLDVNNETRTRYTITYEEICNNVRELVDGTPDSFHDQSFNSADYGQTTHNEILDICRNKFLGRSTTIGTGKDRKRAIIFDKEDVGKVGKGFDVVSKIEIMEGEGQEVNEEDNKEEIQTFWEDWKEQS